MIPLHDDNPTRSPAVVTYALVAVNVLVFIAQLVLGNELTFRFGLIPFEVSGSEPTPGRNYLDMLALAEHYNLQPAWLTIFTSMFLHGSWGHLLGNMVFLAIFGNNIEDVLGKLRFLIFYLLCGAAAAGAHVLVAPGSYVPTIGASGAIAGVLGGYYLLFPHARVKCLVVMLIITIVELPASLVLGFWLLLQVIMGLQGWTGLRGGGEGGVAYSAHVGGFIAGLVLIKLLGGKPHPVLPRYYPDPDRFHLR